MTKPRSAEKFLKLNDLSELIGVPKTTVSQRFDRGTYTTSCDDRISTGSGRHTGYSRNTIIRVAISQKLIELNIGVTAANEAASLVTDQPQPGRAAGQTFELGRTLILVTKANGSRIVNCGYDDPLIDICGMAFEAAVIVDVGRIIASVDEALKKETKDQ